MDIEKVEEEGVFFKGILMQEGSSEKWERCKVRMKIGIIECYSIFVEEGEHEVISTLHLSEGEITVVNSPIIKNTRQHTFQVFNADYSIGWKLAIRTAEEKEKWLERLEEWGAKVVDTAPNQLSPKQEVTLEHIIYVPEKSKEKVERMERDFDSDEGKNNRQHLEVVVQEKLCGICETPPPVSTVNEQQICDGFSTKKVNATDNAKAGVCITSINAASKDNSGEYSYDDWPAPSWYDKDVEAEKKAQTTATPNHRKRKAHWLFEGIQRCPCCDI